MAYKYCTATNWGKNFFTHEERRQFHLSGHPGEVWVVGDNLYGDQWISKVAGAIKTKEEAHFKYQLKGWCSFSGVEVVDGFSWSSNFMLSYM